MLPLLAAALLWLAAPAAAQQATVSGTIVEGATQRPLVGVMVQVEGTGLGTLTNAAGRYMLTNVPPGQRVLIAQMIGYRVERQPVDVSAGQSSTIDFQLTQEALALDEIIVTGTPGGTQRRAIGNVVSRIEMADEEAADGAVNLQESIRSQAPGLTILGGGGQIGAGGNVRIRGASSVLLPNEPLVYIDGVRVDNRTNAGPGNTWHGRGANRMNDINPEEIESIEVIKGPAAATLYGTEASGGVIQIITKKGRAAAPTFNFSTSLGANWLPDVSEGVGEQYWRNPANGEIVSFNVYQNELDNGTWDGFQKGLLQSYDLNVRGGTESVRYFGSVGWTDNEGIVPYNWEERLNGRINLGLSPTPSLDADLSFGYIDGGVREMAISNADIWYSILSGRPQHVVSPLKNRGFLWGTPEALENDVSSTGDLTRITSSLQMTHRPASWATQRLTVGLDQTNETNTLLYNRHPDGAAHFFGQNSLGLKNVDNDIFRLLTADYAATANLTVSSAISSATSAGFQYTNRTARNYLSTGRVFPTPTVTTVSGAAETDGGESYVENATVGVYVQEQIGLNDRFFVTAAVRADDNSAFGSNFDIAIYPKVSGTWVISEEPFWREVPGLDQLRLRSAWGASGSQPDAFDALRLYRPTTGPSGASVLTPLSVGNEDLKPERGEELEVGFDVSFLEGRVSAEYTYYNRTTRDAILQRTNPPSSGFPGSQIINAGTIKNWGHEALIRGDVLQRRNFGWNVLLTASSMKNKVADLGGLPPVVMNTIWQFREGYPLGAVFHRQVVSAEYNASKQVVNEMCLAGEDRRDEVVPCSQAQPVYWGRGATPTYEIGFENSFTILNNLQVSARLDARGGNLMEVMDIAANHTTFYNTWKANSQDDPIFDAYRKIGRQPLAFFEGDFIKLRNITATYTLPSGLLDRLNVSRASLSVAASNLATFNYQQWNGNVPGIKGGEIRPANGANGSDRLWDPEVSAPSSQATGTYLSTVPSTRRVEVQLNFSF